VFVDTIACDADPLPAGKLGWPHRAELLGKLTVYSDFSEVEKLRADGGPTLALLRPARIIGLDIKKAESPTWTDEEKDKLLRLQQQAELFDEVEEGKQIRLLEKLPFDFHYRYECDVDGQTIACRHKLVDWEIGALYRNVRRIHGENWEAAFRAKLEQELPSKDLLFLMGTIHRFPHQWLLISLIYPPKPPVENPNQAGLF
jgi:hypothetical protein